MKILHTSDWHLGRGSGPVWLLQAQQTFLDRLIAHWYEWSEGEIGADLSCAVAFDKARSCGGRTVSLAATSARMTSRVDEIANACRAAARSHLHLTPLTVRERADRNVLPTPTDGVSLATPFETPITTNEAVQRIQQREYLLPGIQRECVWSTAQICGLFDSLLCGYPIGSFLIWRVNEEHKADYQFYECVRDYHAQSGRHNPKASLLPAGGLIAVLDGQQRLTSLYLGLLGTHTERRKCSRRDTATNATVGDRMRCETHRTVQ